MKTLKIAFSGDEQLAGLTNPVEMVRLYSDGREFPYEVLDLLGSAGETSGTLSKPVSRTNSPTPWMCCRLDMD